MKKQSFLYYFSHTWTVITLTMIAVVLIAIIFMRERTEGVRAETESEARRSVTLVRVGEISQTDRMIQAIGEVRSDSEADIRTQAAGMITRVPVRLGQFVERGQTIAEIENSEQRARVLQAEAAVASADASLQRIERGARTSQLEILQENVDDAARSVRSAEQSAVNSLRSAGSTIDTIVRNTVDQLFNDPETSTPRYDLLTTNSQLASDLGTKRLEIQTILSQAQQALDTSQIDTELSTTRDNLSEIQTFLDMIMGALQTAIPTERTPRSTIESYKAAIEQARSRIDATTTQLIGASDALNSTRTRLSIAETELRDARSGADSEDITVARAAVTQALAGLRIAEAGLDKTIIRAPFSGEISALEIDAGDIVSMQEPIAEIVSTQETEIVTYITERERADISVGAPAVVNGSIPAFITSISSVLDRATHKIEVRLHVENGEELLRGRSVRVAISTNDRRTEDPDFFTIPLSALKIESDRDVVFTVNEQNEVVAHTVETGSLLGENIAVWEGLSADMWIILDARGLKEGDTVTPL